MQKIIKIIKYFIMGFVSLLTTKYIPKTSINNMELIMISMIISITYAILDMISPSIKIINKSKIEDNY